jgi:DNA-binding transcriptional regulator YhcF (GntR family)
MLSIDHEIEQPKYQQLIDSVLAGIEQGTLAVGQQLPSINEVAGKQGVAKVTVAKAYEQLRQRGIVQARHGKGFYVATADVRGPQNILLLFDTLNAYKETLYDALKAALPAHTTLTIYFHHYDRNLFESLIRSSTGRYTAYVVMPHFNEDVTDLIGLIPPDRLLLIDHILPALKGDFSAVYQDFEQMTYQALLNLSDRLPHYDSLTMIRANDHFQHIPGTLLAGFQHFALEGVIRCKIVDNYHDELVRPGAAFLIFAERDLIALLRQTDRLGLRVGEDVGLISYDDTPVKEILAGGITTISTDFAQMGRTAGQLLTSRQRMQIANPGGLIRRNSL